MQLIYSWYGRIYRLIALIRTSCEACDCLFKVKRQRVCDKTTGETIRYVDTTGVSLTVESDVEILESEFLVD